MANYLITGGHGFIGSHLARSLVLDGHRVMLLDIRLPTCIPQSLDFDCETVVGDVTNHELVQECMQRVDGCFHLASPGSEKNSAGFDVSRRTTNLIGMINVLDAARTHRVPVVYASSSDVYGDNADLLLKENTSLRPLSHNGADKLSAELQAKVSSMVHGVPTTGLRLFNVYGPRPESRMPSEGVVPIFVNRLMQGKTLHIYGDGEQVRDFLYVDDAVRFFRAAMQRESDGAAVFNACSGEAISINQLARSAMSIMGVAKPILYEATRRGDIRGFAGDPTLASQRLGTSSRYRLAEGLYKYIRHQLNADPWQGMNQASSQACFLR